MGPSEKQLWVGREGLHSLTHLCCALHPSQGPLAVLGTASILLSHGGKQHCTFSSGQNQLGFEKNTTNWFLGVYRPLSRGSFRGLRTVDHVYRLLPQIFQCPGGDNLLWVRGREMPVGSVGWWILSVLLEGSGSCFTLMNLPAF